MKTMPEQRREGTWTRLRHRNRRDLITDELILRSLQGETKAAEAKALREWRAQNPANEERYQQVARLWEMRRLMEPYLQGASAPSAQDIVDRASAFDRGAVELDAAVEAGSNETRRFSTPVRLALAATLASLLIGAGIVGYITGRQGARPTFGPIELVTAATEMSSVSLADGSVVRLGPQSWLRVEITDSSRTAILDGRAFFAVEHDPTRPFRVSSEAGEVVVLGTRFDLETRSGDLQLIVVDGAVALAAGGQSVEVQAGQISRLGQDGRLELQNIEAPYTQLGWMEDFVAFEATPLREVVRELETRYGLDIVIGDSALGAQTVTSWSVNRSPEEILTAVCLALGATCTVTDTLSTINRSSLPR
jgi:ferric-dicitrate binding protein FerR (iron transport regulator)